MAQIKAETALETQNTPIPGIVCQVCHKDIEGYNEEYYNKFKGKAKFTHVECLTKCRNANEGGKKHE